MHSSASLNRFPVFVLLAGLGVCVLAGCSASTATRASHTTSRPELLRAATGLVTGRYLMEGGAISPQTGKTADPWPIPGRVTFTGPGGRRTVKVGPDGDFSVRLPPGNYAVSAETPWLGVPVDTGSPCYLPQVVAVRAAATTRVSVYCAVP
jgi:hypothetical protein